MAELTIRPRVSARLLSREIVMLGWAAVSLVGAIVIIVVYDDTLARVGLAAVVVYTAWALWSWGRALRRKVRVLRTGAPSLHLDDLGVRVRYPLTLADPSYLAWTDCAAAVLSQVPVRSPGFRRSVQFVAIHDDRIEGPELRNDPRSSVLSIEPEAARMVWLEIDGQLPGGDDVMGWLRDHRPGLRLVGTGAPTAGGASQSSEE